MSNQRHLKQQMAWLSLSIPLLFSCSSSFAIVQDAPYYRFEEKEKNQWIKDNDAVKAKLTELEKKYGKKPNIIFILTDDVGWGELGWQGGGKNRGTPSPVLDKMAYEGMRFNSAYSEPSCTPSRIAINTGRHPVRTGLISVLWPGQKEGLSPEEVTIAEILSKAGYSTAMWGKWHLGEEEYQAPENQGYDYSYYGLYNGAPFGWQQSYDNYDNKQPATVGLFADFPGEKVYEEESGIKINPGLYQGAKGQKRKPLDLKLTMPDMAKFEDESTKQIVDYINKNSKSDKPFFIYWASYAQQLGGDVKYMNEKFVDKVNTQASGMYAHNEHVKQILQALKENKIDENTLVVWWSDNGPMYGFYPVSGYTWLRGGKGEVTEGGVRVPAMAWWPGMIQPNQDPADMIHLTDLFTTAATIAGATQYIPHDRVIDGIDQTALLLLGEDHSKRKYMFHYSGKKLGAVRYRDIKVHLKEGHGGLPPMTMFNIRRDPGEKFGNMYHYLYTVSPIQILIQGHMKQIKKYPNRKSNVAEEAEMTPLD